MTEPSKKSLSVKPFFKSESVNIIVCRILPAAGILLCLYWAGMNGYVYTKFKRLSNELEQTHILFQEWKEAHEKNLHLPPTPKTISIGRLFARSYFIEYGERADILTDKGDIVQYQPTKDVIRLHEEKKSMLEDFNHKMKSSMVKTLISLAAIAFIILLSFLFKTIGQTTSHLKIASTDKEK